MQTANLVNNIAGTSKMPTPEVGMGATELCWSDRHAYTIIEVKNQREIVVQMDTARRADNNGMSDAQQYAYVANPLGGTREVTQRSNGAWVTKGEGYKNGTHWWIGVRDQYFDFSF